MHPIREPFGSLAYPVPPLPSEAGPRLLGGMSSHANVHAGDFIPKRPDCFRVYSESFLVFCGFLADSCWRRENPLDVEVVFVGCVELGHLKPIKFTVIDGHGIFVLAGPIRWVNGCSEIMIGAKREVF